MQTRAVYDRIAAEHATSITAYSLVPVSSSVVPARANCLYTPTMRTIGLAVVLIVGGCSGSTPPTASPAAPAAPSADEGPPTTLAKPGPRATPGEIPGAEDYPDAESLPEQPEEGSKVLLAGDAAPIFGVVLDKDGNPWPEVQVVLGPECGEAMVAFTDADGRFEARGFPRCQIEIFAEVGDSRDSMSVLPGEKSIEVELRPQCKADADDCPSRAARAQ